LARAQQELAVAREQVAFQSGVADEAQVRMVVSGTPLADREFREARDDLERLKRHEQKTTETIDELSEERDRLLERLFEDIDSAEEHSVEQELAAVLILTAFSHRDKVARATRAGVMAYLVKPFDKADLVPAIEVAVQRWNEARVLANESKNLTERLETRKLVERAKAVLRDRHGLSEEDAFRLIQRISMERDRKSVVEGK